MNYRRRDGKRTHSLVPFAARVVWLYCCLHNATFILYLHQHAMPLRTLHVPFPSERVKLNDVNYAGVEHLKAR